MAAAKPENPRNPPAIPQLDAPPSIPDPRIRVFCEILTRVPPAEVELALSRCGIQPLPEHVETVLKLSYSNAAAAVKFFRWSGLSLKHTPYAWNLMVDLLGKSGLFEPMWDAIRSMKQEGALSTTTFASSFGSYCSAGKFKEAIMTFDVMDRYGVTQDVVAVNSLLSAICREVGHTADAVEFFERVKTRISPDADTFAILLEGWEKEGNVGRAKNTFGEMVIRVGWNADNMSAYDAFLTTLVRGSQAEEAVKFLKVMKAKNCLPGMKFFSNSLDILIKQNDHVHALAFWDIMVGGSGLIPNLIMYNAMIALLCNNRVVDYAYRFLDEMPFHGAFPDLLTYNTIFEGLIKNRKAHEAGKFLAEMRKNDQPPSSSNCVAAIKMFFEEYDPMAAIEVWNCVVEERVSPVEECANELLVGLRDMKRLNDVTRYAEDMLDMGIELRSSTMEILKTAFNKSGKEEAYSRRRSKRH